LDGVRRWLADDEDRLGTITHNYKRHGTTVLFAALDVLQGKVIGPSDEASSPPSYRLTAQSHTIADLEIQVLLVAQGVLRLILIRSCANAPPTEDRH
jgi:hypothetical protein